MTKIYTVKLIYPTKSKKIHVSEQDAKQKGNVYNFVAEDARNLIGLQRIEVEMHNDLTGGTYTQVTYDRQYEAWKEERTRIERIDTDGTRERFYIGKSTGWVPCYLEIKRRDSSGGGKLYEKGIFTTV